MLRILTTIPIGVAIIGALKWFWWAIFEIRLPSAIIGAVRWFWWAILG